MEYKLYNLVSEPGIVGYLGEVMAGYCPPPKQCRAYFGVMK